MKWRGRTAVVQQSFKNSNKWLLTIKRVIEWMKWLSFYRDYYNCCMPLSPSPRGMFICILVDTGIQPLTCMNNGFLISPGSQGFYPKSLSFHFCMNNYRKVMFSLAGNTSLAAVLESFTAFWEICKAPHTMTSQVLYWMKGEVMTDSMVTTGQARATGQQWFGCEIIPSCKASSSWGSQGR